MALTPGQQRCVDTLDRPLVVAAGAGSGKTFTLTQRIAGAFEGTPEKSPFITDIDEVCAITFTTKAAAELKSRIKGELRARGRIDQALRVDEAWISTIHGMCARILRAHAVELGIDPAFRVAEGAEAASYMAQAIDAVLVDAQAEDSPALDALFAEYPARSSGGFGTSVEGMLKDVVGTAASLGGNDSPATLPGITMAPAMVVEQAISIVESLLAAAQGEKESAKRDGWIAATSQALQGAQDALSGGIADHASALRIVAPFKLAKTFGGKDYKSRVDEARGALGSCVMEARLGAAKPHLETLMDLARRVLDVFAQLKRKDGVLDNDDLLVMAARAIENHADIAAQYADKFKLVMVDEFQDTDQMQVDMIKRLSGEGACRLCTVGDAQQSIYRFRGADVSVYRRHLASVKAAWPESVIELSDNFRSNPDVLAFVDCVFEKPSMFGGEFMSLAPGRDESKVKLPFAEGAPRIVVQHTSKPWRGVAAATAIEVAAARIADEFAQLAQAGHSPGEMVVLLGRMSHADVYAQALRERGLPCIVAGGSVFSRSIEAQMIAQLARVIANPGETQSLFNVLTSPLFALTAGDLLQAGGVKGFWRYALEEEPDRNPEAGAPANEAPSPKLSCACWVMSRMRSSIGREPVARIMERVLADSGWLSRMQQEGAEGLASAGNAYKAIRMVQAIESAGATGPASVSRLFSHTLESAKEAPGALSVSGGDSARIMTIHASKGLEFPIVAVAEVKENRAPSSRLLASTVGGRAYLSLDLGRTLDEIGDLIDAATMTHMREYVLGLAAGEDELAAAIAEDAGALHRRLALREYIAAGDEEEAKRLLYVAITRAKEALVISSVGTRTKDNPLGIPKSALAGVFSALDPTGALIGEGRSTCDYGGSRPAVVECLALDADSEAAPVDTPSHPAGLPDDAGALDASFSVPVAERRESVAWEPCSSTREGVFSYTSISDAVHEGDLLARLAEDFAVSVDASWPVNMVESETTAADRSAAATADDADKPPMPTTHASFDDDFWDYDVSGALDEDRATDLGTAFHRLAQYAVVTRRDGEPLSMPSAARIEALARSCNLDAKQRIRLDAALNRWFGSKLASDMSSFSNLSAEVPFFVTVPSASDGEGSYLEGEIDLIGFNETRDHAVVVDYKTGGYDGEPDDDLRKKHVLQASCYAYAIMRQGISTVDAVFVRVERPQAGNPAEPQCVRYHFTSLDIPRLSGAIADAYGKLMSKSGE